MNLIIIIVPASLIVVLMLSVLIYILFRAKPKSYPTSPGQMNEPKSPLPEKSISFNNFATSIPCTYRMKVFFRRLSLKEGVDKYCINANELSFFNMNKHHIKTNKQLLVQYLFFLSELNPKLNLTDESSMKLEIEIVKAGDPLIQQDKFVIVIGNSNLSIHNKKALVIKSMHDDKYNNAELQLLFPKARISDELGQSTAPVVHLNAKNNPSTLKKLNECNLITTYISQYISAYNNDDIFDTFINKTTAACAENAANNVERFISLIIDKITNAISFQPTCGEMYKNYDTELTNLKDELIRNNQEDDNHEPNIWGSI